MIQTYRLSVAPLLLISMSLLTAEAQSPRKLTTDFNKDRAGWQIYDYNGGKAGGGKLLARPQVLSAVGVHPMADGNDRARR